MDGAAIRPAAAGELNAITAIYADAVRNGTSSYELDPPSHDEMQARFRALAAGGFPYLVAEADGAVAGYAYAGPFRQRPAYRFLVEDSIYLAANARGKGLGQLLLTRLVETTIALGFRQIVAVLGDGRPGSASVRLHETLGFRHAGRLVGSGFKHGRWLDTVFLQLELNGGSTVPPEADSLPDRLFNGPA